MLLQEEISNKKIRLEKLKNELNIAKEELYGRMSVLDFLYITSLFLDSNAKSIEKNRA